MNENKMPWANRISTCGTDFEHQHVNPNALLRINSKRIKKSNLCNMTNTCCILVANNRGEAVTYVRPPIIQLLDLFILWVS